MARISVDLFLPRRSRRGTIEARRAAALIVTMIRLPRRSRRGTIEAQLATLKGTNRWHPSALSGVGDDAIRSQDGARPLSEAEWGRLAPVGHLSTEAIVFHRAGAELLPSGEATLDKLIDTLRSWPHYYLIVRGHARMEGDAEANKRLADERAATVAAHLAQHGIAEHRVRAFGAETTATGGEAQTVTFVLGQLPY